MMIKKAFFTACLLLSALLFCGAGEAGASSQAFDMVTNILPVLSLETREGISPSDEYITGDLTLYEPADKEPEQKVKTPMRIKLRGNTSRRFPKKSLRIVLTDEEENKRPLSLAGLREDEDWILNPMYSDTSKIRETISYRLWEQINSCGTKAASSRITYVELILNGRYMGLYGLQERVDRKQVQADKKDGILYKVDANDRPSVSELLSLDQEEVCHGLELEFAGSEVSHPWLPAADYLAFLEGSDPFGTAALSLENTIDYGLWAMLVQARDGHYKNQFIHCVSSPSGYVLYRIPWDLNHTLGDLWDGDSPETNFLTWLCTPLEKDDAFHRLLEKNDPEINRKIKERWQQLRQTDITEEKILSHAHSLFEALYPAIGQDTKAWPECGMGEGNAANIRDIERYFQYILPRMDEWVSSLEG